ncbi:hypothetical protein M0804_005473 [Polistes exclamans]|nr:hypothetical protein M0804_005473 [Polistes exclamans]
MENVSEPVITCEGNEIFATLKFLSRDRRGLSVRGKALHFPENEQTANTRHQLKQPEAAVAASASGADAGDLKKPIVSTHKY